MRKIRKFDEFLDEKKSPYKKATLLKYKRKWEKGEKIPVGVENSLKAQGMIPRANGEIEVSADYEDDPIVQVKPLEKKKKVIKESFEETLNNIEITLSFTDKEGHSVEVKEIEGTGMAGEPMTFAYIFHKGKLSSKEKVKPHLKNADYKELCDYLNDIYDNNEASAISFIV